ncbi:MAG: hypothetical protein H6672_08195 [Anaerolineaceae bacterium]|nr:hypothetical protein [Anaerolineaceae bacterium]
MTKPSDIQARLRLFRYGLVVIVAVTFLISLLAPYAALRFVNTGGVAVPPITDFLGTAILYTIIVSVVAILAYYAYRYVLKNTTNKDHMQEQ